jgi:hypothetical protein
MPAIPYNSEITPARERLEKFLYEANAKKTSYSGADSGLGRSGGRLVSLCNRYPFRRIESGEFGIGNGGRPADQATRQVFSCCSYFVFFFGPIFGVW